MMNQSNSFSDVFEKSQIKNQSLLVGVPDTNGTGSDIPTGQNSTFINNVYSIANSSVAVLCFATSIVHILIILVLHRCRKMTTSLKSLSINFLCNSLLFFVFIFLTNILSLTLTEAYTQPFLYVRMMCAADIYASHVGATGGLALERLIRITYPLSATRILKQRNVNAYIVSTWIIGFLPSITVTLQRLAQCDFSIQTCDLEYAANVTRIVVFCTYSCFTILICYSYMKISKVINCLRDRHGNKFQASQADIDMTNVDVADRTLGVGERNISSHLPNTRNRFRATGYILKISITFVICHIPIIANFILFVLFPDLETTYIATPIQFLSFICSIVSFYVSSHFFIWKLRECKLVFMQMFCSWNERLNDVTHELKMEMYNIPMAVRRVTSPGKVHQIQ